MYKLEGLKNNQTRMSHIEVNSNKLKNMSPFSSSFQN